MEESCLNRSVPRSTLDTPAGRTIRPYSGGQVYLRLGLDGTARPAAGTPSTNERRKTNTANPLDSIRLVGGPSLTNSSSSSWRRQTPRPQTERRQQTTDYHRSPHPFVEDATPARSRPRTWHGTRLSPPQKVRRKKEKSDSEANRVDRLTAHRIESTVEEQGKREKEERNTKPAVTRTVPHAVRDERWIGNERTAAQNTQQNKNAPRSPTPRESAAPPRPTETRTLCFETARDCPESAGNTPHGAERHEPGPPTRTRSTHVVGPLALSTPATNPSLVLLLLPGTVEDDCSTVRCVLCVCAPHPLPPVSTFCWLVGL